MNEPLYPLADCTKISSSVCYFRCKFHCKNLAAVSFCCSRFVYSHLSVAICFPLSYAIFEMTLLWIWILILYCWMYGRRRPALSAHSAHMTLFWPSNCNWVLLLWWSSSRIPHSHQCSLGSILGKGTNPTTEGQLSVPSLSPYKMAGLSQASGIKYVLKSNNADHTLWWPQTGSS